MSRLLQWFYVLHSRKKIALSVLAFLLVWYLFSLPGTLFDAPYSTLVSDRNGELLGARIASDGQWRFPPADSVPGKYEICLIQFEDRHFRYHPGVNPLALGRAMTQNLKAGRVVSGGSTITMQTVRLTRRNKRTYFEKFIEVILATRLELSYSKKQILALYASHAPMGGNVVGIDAASWRYFGHSAESLSWGEAAVLAVLPNSPGMMHFGRDREGLLKKRNRLLRQLLDDNTIDRTDYELAVSEPLPDHPHPLPQIAPHLVTQAFLRNPGDHIQSTVDKHLQMRAEEVLDRWNTEFSQNGIFNLAALIVDLQTNEVLSYNGNVGFGANAYGSQVDIIQSPRSTGSILKPFLYCAMLQEGMLLPAELLPDVPININGFAPKNFSLAYDGAVHADEALARSLNVPSVVSLRRYGVAKFYDLLKKAGMTTLNRPADHYGLSLILGGTEGTLWDIANAYARMAQTVTDYTREATYYEWENFRLLRDHQPRERHVFGKLNEQSQSSSSFAMTKNSAPRSKPDESPLFNAGAAWLTLQALTNVNRPEELNWDFVPSVRRVAWKTGTSYGFRDAWAVGVTPKYLVAVWTGNASGEGRPGLTGARTSARVMFDLFNILPATGWFETPYGELAEAAVCRESGQLKGMYCPESSIDTLLIPARGLQGAVCGYHRRVHLSEDGQYRVYEQCAGDRGIRSVSWFQLPPSWEWYYKQRHPAYRSLPPFSPECDSGNISDAVMQFIYPYPGAILRITKQLDGSRGKAVFELAHRNPSARVFWHLGADYLGETSNIHQMELSPDPGEHTLTVVDENGISLSIRFKVD
ncbi:penicillin-binding protein 1C [Proteiniphilum sp. X52]|uniref:penicillin-binding protein 1C n=1 Tax=Proteiniphilum sp. X52 TaxID=2382159 RepID=UPI000F0A1D56|nr:penicillin-binding protein 1C [Proteiniphilum sp. X52]RNC66595.1 penicillin-binding protein 1C [Proteiniphilum sp. X52]